MVVITGTTKSDSIPNKRVFKINFENIPDDEIDEYVFKIAEKFKKSTDLDIPNEELFINKKR
jgi:hypothetical protein